MTDNPEKLRVLFCGAVLQPFFDLPSAEIMDVLKANSFSRNLTANQLGINRTTLYKKMKRLGIENFEFQD